MGICKFEFGFGVKLHGPRLPVPVIGAFAEMSSGAIAPASPTDFGQLATQAENSTTMSSSGTTTTTPATLSSSTLAPLTEARP